VTKRRRRRTLQRDLYEAKLKIARRALVAEEQKAKRVLRKKEVKLLDFVERLFAVVQVVKAHELTRVPRSLCGIVALAVYSKIFGDARAILKLCLAGRGREAPTLTRSAVEALITLAFVTQKDCSRRAKLWIEYSDILRWKALRASLELQQVNPENSEKIRKRAEAAMKNYPRKDFWASGCGVPNLREMATSVGLIWYYNDIYWSGSQPTHSSEIAVSEYLPIASHKPLTDQPGISIRHARPELAAASDALISGLRLLNAAFELKIDALVADLTRRYSAAIGSKLRWEGSSKGTSTQYPSASGHGTNS